MASRVLAVLAAVFLIGAFALATLGPPNMPLGQALFVIDRGLLPGLQAGVKQYLWPWVWDGVLVPLLLRPAWLLPAAVGLILGGAAATTTSRPAHGSRRRS